MKRITKILTLFFAVSVILFVTGTVFAGTIINNPMFRAWDDNGDPLSGGLLNSYIVGTSTRKALYTDKACTTPATNPVVLDSNGEAEIYGLGNYKLVLTDADAVTLWTHPNYEGANDHYVDYCYPDYAASDHGVTGDSNTIKYCVDTASSNSATIFLRHNSGSATTTYTLTTSETIPSNVKVIIEEGAQIDGAGTLTTYSPENLQAGQRQQIFGSSLTAAWTKSGTVYCEWWGGKADNSTNNATALQSAITSIAGTKGKLKLNAGEYNFGSTLTGLEDLYIEGEHLTSTYLDYTAATGNGLEPDTNATNIVLSDFTLGGSGGSTGWAIYFYEDVANHNIRHLNIQRVAIGNEDAAAGSRWKNGINVLNMTGGVIRDCYLIGQGKAVSGSIGIFLGDISNGQGFTGNTPEITNVHIGSFETGIDTNANQCAIIKPIIENVDTGIKIRHRTMIYAPWFGITDTDDIYVYSGTYGAASIMGWGNHTNEDIDYENTTVESRTVIWPDAHVDGDGQFKVGDFIIDNSYVRQARVWAYQSAAGDSVADSATWSQLTLEAEAYDNEGDNNATNFASSTFTCPTTGYYQVHAQVLWENPADETLIGIKIYHNTSDRGIREIGQSGTADVGLNVFNVLSCAASDTIKIYVRQQGHGGALSTKTGIGHTYVNIVRLP